MVFHFNYNYNTLIIGLKKLKCKVSCQLPVKSQVAFFLLKKLYAWKPNKLRHIRADDIKFSLCGHIGYLCLHQRGHAQTYIITRHFNLVKYECKN